MSSLLPLASFNLALEPFVPTQAIDSDLPVTVHLTLAALDPNAIDDEEQPSTLRILKATPLSKLLDEDEDDEDDEDNEDEDEDELDIADVEAEDDDEDVDAEDDEDDNEDDEDEDDEDDEDDDDLDDDDVEEFVVCTLSPKSQFQQTLDFTISPDEEIFFVVTGSYPIHLSGNYVEHPYDGEDSDDFDSDEDEDDEEFDSDEYDLTPDEDELAEEDFDVNDLENEADIEAKIQELVDEEEAREEAEAQESKKDKKKSKKESKKRQAEETQPEPETKKSKKEKAVQFNKELEQGPTPSEKKKPAVKTLAGGVVIEDRTVGTGPVAKNGSKVGVRYIGKLKNGSVFDKNTSGKPFQFGLGKGEVIKGWDIGVAGMAVGGERRIVIPAPYAYGKKKLPGIPANSELTFDVKLVSLK